MNPDFYKISNHLNDYLKGKDKLTPFYAEPLSPDWKKISQNVYQNFKRHEVINELIEQNKEGADNSTQKNIDLLKKGNTLMVVTGQQLGLMVSPLYVIYKTLTTIKLAEKLNREVEGYNFIPVYWLEGEDHDFKEVNHLSYFDSSGNLAQLYLEEKESERGLSMNKRLIGQDVERLQKTLKEQLQRTDFSDALFDRLEKMYKSGGNWLEVFAAHLNSLFKGTGLLLFNVGTKRIKELSKPFFEKVIIENETLVSAFAEKSVGLEDAGYKNQVKVQKERSYLFLNYDNGPRLSLLRKNGGFYLREPDKQFSMKELLTVVDKKPHWFSSTVLTRPLWQSWLLPTVAYVAGAAEVAYWGQLRSGFNLLGLPMPQVQPRHSVTLIEPKIERLISKYKINVHTIPPNKTKFLKDYFNRNQLATVSKAFTDFEQQALLSRQTIQELVLDIDPTLTGPTEKSFNSILSSVEKLRNRLVNRVREKEVITQKHLSTIFDALMPGGVLQERVISAVYFENKYGPGWLKIIADKIDDNFNEHIIVKI